MSVIFCWWSFSTEMLNANVLARFIERCRINFFGGWYCTVMLNTVGVKRCVTSLLFCLNFFVMFVHHFSNLYSLSLWFNIAELVSDCLKCCTEDSDDATSKVMLGWVVGTLCLWNIWIHLWIVLLIEIDLSCFLFVLAIGEEYISW